MTRLHPAGRALGLPLLLLLTGLIPTPARGAAAAVDDAPEPFEFRDGDRVAFIGNTFVEREQVYSYLETLLRSRYPDRDITFRNLGWSGDTVFGHARSYFDPPEKGFERLDKIAHELKPTVIFISYGMGESFDGEPGLAPFRQGFERMLDMLKDLDARTVIIGPTRHEDLGPPLPDPTEHNGSLRMYADALKEIAASRGHRYIDLYEMLGDGAKVDPPAPLTDNGIHLTPFGYWRAAHAIEQGLGLPPRGWDVTVLGDEVKVSGVLDPSAVRSEGGPAGYKITIKAPVLPVPPPPAGSEFDAPPRHERRLKVLGLKAGNYVLTAGGEPVAKATAEEWGTGVDVVHDPGARTAERVRDIAIFKNVQYFNQWRPANETYIFGFRAYEQGRNAAEMPMFDEPIAKLEAEITKLVQPAEVTYELRPE
jgi:lysophospholipase L1-like esterase